MNDLFNSLDSGEVISIQKDAQVLVGHRIFRVSELNEAIANYLKTSVGNWTEEKGDWFTTQGIDCEALRFGSTAWQKGRIRLCLEFCPDEVNPAASRAVTNSTPVVATPAQAVPIAPSVAPVAASVAPIVTQSIADPTPAVTPVLAPPTSPSIAVNTTNTAATNIPVAGIAAVGAGAAVMAATAAATVESVQIPTVKVVAPADPVAPIPAIADVILETDDKPAATSRESLDEIAFDFDVSTDNLGTMVPNGMMELDLTDLDLDRAENDYLDFENSALADPTLELNPIHSLDKSENSGMLIDEVWNEMSQPNWPGIH
jgi:hypothetical protein